MKILVIDDEPKAREYMRSGLTESGYVVDVAVNGREGLFMAQEYHYDLILLDVMMPELDGWEVMKTLDAQNIPVIFLTAKAPSKTGSKGWNWVPTTIWSSLSRLPSCWRVSARHCGAARTSSVMSCCRSVICSWTGRNVASNGPGCASI